MLYVLQITHTRSLPLCILLSNFLSQYHARVIYAHDVKLRDGHFCRKNSIALVFCDTVRACIF